jgi:hypothetical protein
MQSSQWIFRIRAFALTLVALAAMGALLHAQVQPAAGAPTGAPQNAGFCGGRPLCFDAGDFGATIAEFRTSEASGFKIVDELVHFQNKTDQPLILGYSDGSASAIDDRGNRFTMNPYGGNGLRGMGVVSGNNMDPKFVLQPGGGGDARFELIERLGPLQGVTYETELSIREINRIEGGQFVLGGETLMHYQGLSNGMGVAAPAYAAGQTPYNSAQGQDPCSAVSGAASTSTNTANQIAGATNSASVQNTTSNATSQVSNAANTLSSLGSLFHKKTTTPPASPTNTASTTPCPAGMAPATGSAYSGSPAYNGASGYSGTPVNGVSQQPMYQQQQMSQQPYQQPSYQQPSYQQPSYQQQPYQQPTYQQQTTQQPMYQQQPTYRQPTTQQPMNANAKAVVTPTSPVKTAVSVQPVTAPAKMAVQPVKTTGTAPVKPAVQAVPVQQAKAPAQPVKAVAKTPVPPAKTAVQ